MKAIELIGDIDDQHRLHFIRSSRATVAFPDSGSASLGDGERQETGKSYQN